MMFAWETKSVLRTISENYKNYSVPALVHLPHEEGLSM